MSNFFCAARSDCGNEAESLNAVRGSFEYLAPVFDTVAQDKHTLYTFADLAEIIMKGLTHYELQCLAQESEPSNAHARALRLRPLLAKMLPWDES